MSRLGSLCHRSLLCRIQPRSGGGVVSSASASVATTIATSISISTSVTSGVTSTERRWSSSLVSWEIDEDSDQKVGIITLRSPHTYNALTVEMGREFEALVSQIGSDIVNPHQDTKNANAEIGAIVLRGEGSKAFSAGGDIAWLKSLSDNSVHANVDLMLGFYQSFLCLREKLPVPVVAAVSGPAMGAGACLALACDLRVGVSHPRLLGFPFARLGIPSGMGAAHFLGKCGNLGSTKVAEILLLGQTLSGEEAFAGGLLNRITTTQEDVQHEALLLAREIVTTSHPVAVRSLVRGLRLGMDHGAGGGAGGGSLSECLYKDAHAQALCYNRRDWGEGLDAVASKRDPEFDDYHCK